jgi:ankyrin repeat protein
MEAACGHLPILQTLLKQQVIAIDAVEPQQGYTAYHYACHKGRANCAVELVRRGCDTQLWSKNGHTGKEVAERSEHTAVIEGLRTHVLEQLRESRDSDGTAKQSVLALAAEFLGAAAEHGDCQGMRELLDGGGASVVNVEANCLDGETIDKAQTTVLIQAVVYNQHAAVELLLSAEPTRTSRAATAAMRSWRQQLAASCTSCRHCLGSTARPSLSML